MTDGRKRKTADAVSADGLSAEHRATWTYHAVVVNRDNSRKSGRAAREQHGRTDQREGVVYMDDIRSVPPDRLCQITTRSIVPEHASRDQSLLCRAPLVDDVVCPFETLDDVPMCG